MDNLFDYPVHVLTLVITHWKVVSVAVTIEAHNYCYEFVLIIGSAGMTLIFFIPRSYVWEILHSTIRKMSKHVARLQKDMVDSRDSRRRRRGGTAAGGGTAGARRASDESESDSENSSDEESSARPRPTEEEIEKMEQEMEKMEEKLETAQADQKNLFLIIFQVTAGERRS